MPIFILDSRCQSEDTKPTIADPQTVRFSIEERNVRSRMLETYGKEGTTMSCNSDHILHFF